MFVMEVTETQGRQQSTESDALVCRGGGVGVARGGTYCDLLPASAALGTCLLPTLEFCAGGL